MLVQRGAFKEANEHSRLNIELYSIQPKVGSFSVASTPIFTTKYSFSAVFKFYVIIPTPIRAFPCFLVGKSSLLFLASGKRRGGGNLKFKIQSSP